MVKTSLNKGYVTQIIGPVLDIEFSDGNLPESDNRTIILETIKFILNRFD